MTTRSQLTASLAAAALTGLLAGTAPAAKAAPIGGSGITKGQSSSVATSGVLGKMLADGATSQAGKHDCKGKNDCKGQGGCKSSDNGCKGKNSCKGKGGCSTADAKVA